MDDPNSSADVIVVGAGFAGLSAADQLTRQGFSVIVLEARGRVGGRTLSTTLDNGVTVDFGGQWIGPKQLNINQLLDRFAIPTIPTYDGGSDLKLYNGHLYAETPWPAQMLLDRIDQLGSDILLDSPWLHWRAPEWDHMTFATWLRQETVDVAAANLVARGVAGGLLAGDAGDYSLLHTLWYVASGGGIASMMDCVGGAQDERIVGGAQVVAQALAHELGSAVRLNEPVRRIVQYADSVVVTTDNADYTGRHVVVAIPPTLAGRIDYHPALPVARDGLMQRMAAGSALKAHVFYRRPFWRESGWSGYAITDHGVVAETFDNSPPDGSFFDLVVFVYGGEAHALRGQCQRCQAELIINDLVRLYGPDARNEVVGFLTYDWAREPWTRGCFSAHMPPGGWLSYGPALRTSFGRIRWAGTEHAVKWSGYIDGAIESGLRAAAEITSAAATGA